DVHRVERFVAKVLEDFAIELIRTALGDDRHHSTGGPANLCRRLADVDAKFTNASLREVLAGISARALLIRHAVDEKRVLADRRTGTDADAHPARHGAIGVRSRQEKR